MKQIRISDDLHQRMVSHCRFVRRSLTQECSHALDSLLDGQIFTDLAIFSEGETEIIVTISDSGGPNMEIDRFFVESVGGIVSRGANLRNCVAQGRVPLEPGSEYQEVSKILRKKGYEGELPTQAMTVLGDLEAIESVVE